MYLVIATNTQSSSKSLWVSENLFYLQQPAQWPNSMNCKDYWGTQFNLMGVLSLITNWCRPVRSKSEGNAFYSNKCYLPYRVRFFRLSLPSKLEAKRLQCLLVMEYWTALSQNLAATAPLPRCMQYNILNNRRWTTNGAMGIK